MNSSAESGPPAPWQVSELLAHMHQRLDAEYGAVQVEGEVSGFMQARSGHRYFALKDRDGQIRCAWFRHSIRGQPIAEGQHVIAYGRLSVYGPRGDLQLVVSTVADAGAGALAATFERLKRALAAEGLFDAARKPPLPAVVHRLLIITSPQAAALQDVRVTLARRDPFLDVELAPVRVQGADAAEQIARALEQVRADAPYDAILLTRGGGSLEDLQAFNTERVARAIARCPLPVVSAVGHETDVSISDFVASLRAATPTAAAELLSIDRRQQNLALSRAQQRLHGLLQRQLATHQQRQQQLLQRLQRQAPQRRLDAQTQRLDQLQAQLMRLITWRLSLYRKPVQNLRDRLLRSHPMRVVALGQQRQQGLQVRLQRTLPPRIRQYQEQLRALRKRLDSVNPRRVLDRGYALVYADKQLIVRQQQWPPGAQTLRIEWADGARTVPVGATKDK